MKVVRLSALHTGHFTVPLLLEAKSKPGSGFTVNVAGLNGTTYQPCCFRLKHTSWLNIAVLIGALSKQIIWKWFKVEFKTTTVNKNDVHLETNSIFHIYIYIYIYIHTYRVIQNPCRGHTQYTRDGTPCYFFLGGYIKDQVYVPPLSASIPELKVRIRTAIGTIAADMRNELNYRVDVCRITKGAHIGHL